MAFAPEVRENPATTDLRISPSRSRKADLPKALSVMVGAFDPIVARGLASVLQDAPGLRIVAADVATDALVEGALALRPSVILVDELLGSAGIEDVRSVVPEAGFVVFAKDPTSGYGRLLLASGVSCVTRSVSPPDLLATVCRVGRGDRVFVSPDGNTTEWREGDPEAFSRREQQVLRYLSQDLSPARIAEELGMAPRTVGTHATRIYQKLEVGGRRELVEMLAQGWFGSSVRQLQQQ